MRKYSNTLADKMRARTLTRIDPYCGGASVSHKNCNFLQIGNAAVKFVEHILIIDNTH